MATSQWGLSGAAVKKERRWLITAIRTRLLPEFVRRGFEVVPLPKDAVTDRELSVNSPFGTLRREAGPGLGFELVEIELRTYGRAAFRLVAGVSPPNGMETIAGHIASGEVLVGWLDEFFEFYQFPRLWAILPTMAFFSVKRWPWQKATQDDYDALVLQTVSLIPEIERALRENRIGPHTRRVQFKHPRPERTTE